MPAPDRMREWSNPIALVELADLVLQRAASQRDAINDSDLDDEQPVVVCVSASLGLLRRAGLDYVHGYRPQLDKAGGDGA